ncbi:MAG TPA: DUF4114 domain-containing protein [Tepidisphaeraceae bacterium]|nr:DUF4114 domain-containing protein [Tepidisphaeraceae bacterium]
MKKITAMLSFAAVAAASFVGASQANAAFTTIQPARASEQSIPQILGHVYGGAFVDAGNGVDLTNGSLTATRIDDAADQTLSLGKILSAKALARFAASNQKFGIMNGKMLDVLFDVSGTGYAVSGSVANVDTGASPVAVGRGGWGGTFSSVDAMNSDLKDHMVSYVLSGQGVSDKTYVLFFEDIAGRGSDWDYNDMAVEVQAAAVPLPGALAMGLVTMAGGAVARRFRKA